jgi:hypothetical protein
LSVFRTGAESHSLRRSAPETEFRSLPTEPQAAISYRSDSVNNGRRYFMSGYMLNRTQRPRSLKPRIQQASRACNVTCNVTNSWRARYNQLASRSSRSASCRFLLLTQGNFSVLVRIVVLTACVVRHELSSPARTLGSWVRMPLVTWMSV